MTEIDGLVDEVFGDLVTDEDVLELPGGPIGWKALPLRPERVTSTRAVLESADLDIRTCQHELAYALAAVSGFDVGTFEVPVEFENAARRVRDLIREYPRCKLKGAS